MSELLGKSIIPTWYKIDHCKKVVDFTSVVDSSLSTLESAEIAINYILETYPKPYHIMVSGGIDSQAMMYAWKLFGKNFIPTYVTYNINLNNHDLITLFEFSKNHKIDLNTYDFDVFGFYNSEYKEYVYKYRCPSPHLTVYLAMTKDLPGTVILTGNFLGNPSSIPFNQIGLHNGASTRVMIPFFFWSHPNLAYSSIINRKKNNYFETTRTLLYDYRVKEYIQMGFPVISQGTTKYTGFEQIKEIYNEKYKPANPALTKLKYYATRRNYIPYEEMLRYPYEQEIGFINYKGILNSDI